LPAPTDEPLRFAPLGPADAETLSALHARCFATGWSAADFRRLALEEHYCGLAAFQQRVIVGFAIAQLAAGEAEILIIAVAPECRHTGIGAALLGRLARELTARGAATLFLEVNIDNRAALALYEKAGFIEVGRRRGYYHTLSGAQDALILRRPLSAEPGEIP
jgi:ribosomal-protein-alanine N-acetyltransferase